MFRDKSASRTCPVGRFAVTTVDDSDKMPSCCVPVCNKPCSCCDCDCKDSCKVACCVKSGTKSLNCVPPCFDYNCKDNCKTIACKNPCSHPCKSIPACIDYDCKGNCKTIACKNPCKSLTPCFDYDCKDNCKSIESKNPCKFTKPCFDYDCKSVTLKSVKDSCKCAPACASEAIGCFPALKLNAGDSDESFCKPVWECCSLTSCCDQDVKNVVVSKGKQPCGKMTAAFPVLKLD